MSNRFLKIFMRKDIVMIIICVTVVVCVSLICEAAPDIIEALKKK